MNGVVAQLVSLISYGNDYLLYHKLSDNYYSGNTTFKYCHNVCFKAISQSFWSMKKKEVTLADHPNEWFKYLKENGCRELKLYYHHSKDQSQVKDYMLAGFIDGGGTWLIEAMYEQYSNFWYAHWEVIRKDDPNDQIWSVVYKEVIKKESRVNLQFDAERNKMQLQQTLLQIKEFAYQHKEDHWGDWFNRALDTLKNDQPSKGFFHPDLIVQRNYDLLHQQLIFGAGNAWVFGGMGSWNDLGFAPETEQEKYKTFTGLLYEACIAALLAGIN